ncbi:hypothetical protein LTS06_007274 [Exophiala xenobiotica]|nr:hypothetical protein LTS06_007274 [Exophiala xenobiotica]
MVWTAQSFSTTIVAATVVEIVNTDLHTTSLSTQYNDIPAGYTIPTNTNAQGTQTVELVYARSDQSLTTDVAFPTPFDDLPQEYLWSGTLATTDAAGNSVCSTASTTVTGLVDYYSQESGPFTTPPNPYGPDPGGLFYTTSWTEVFTSMAQTYKSMFPDIAALQTCSAFPAPFPAVVELTARFITATTVSYVGGGGGSQSSTSAAVQGSAGTQSSKATPGSSSIVASPGSSPASQTVASPSQTANSASQPVSSPSQTVNSASQSDTITSGTQSAALSASQTVVTLTSLSTSVSEGSSGPVTSINTVSITSIAPASPSGGTAGGTAGGTTTTSTTTNNTPKMKSSMTMVACMGAFVTLVLGLCL